MAVDHNNPQSRDEEILISMIDGEEYDKLPQSRLEELLLELKEVIEAGGGGGGTTNYNNLSNLPKINNVTVKGEMTASDLSLVLAEVGKGLSTNDYSDEEKAKVANLLAAIEGILTGSDIDSFGDVESALANKVDKVNGKSLSTNDFTDTYKDAIDANTTAITAIKDGTDIDSFGDVEVALLDKADISDLGTAAAKDSTNSVTAGSTDLVESGAVKDAIDAAVASAYHHAGTKTVAQLTHDLLIAANEGDVYNITDSGTTTSDFIEGIGKQIDAGDNVGICKVGNVYMFDLLSGLEDTSIFVQKSQTAGLLKNDGTVNSTIEDTVAGHTTAIAGKVDKVNGKGLSTNDFTDTYKNKVDNNKGAIEAIVNEYGAKNLLPNIATSQTLNGVTFTVNADGSVTVDGTATAKIDFNIARQDVDGFHLESGSYAINGCPDDGGSESYHLLMSVNNTWGTKDIGQGVTVDGTVEAVVIRVMSGATVNNKTFYPMVRDARISDDTYIPFVMTNRQLMDSKQPVHDENLQTTAKDIPDAINELKSGLTNNFVNLITANAISVANTAKAGTTIAKAQLRHDNRFAELIINITNADTFDTGDTGVMLNIDWSKTGVSINEFKSACGTCNTSADYPDFAHAGAISAWTLSENGDVYMRLSETGIKAARLCFVFKLAW